MWRLWTRGWGPRDWWYWFKREGFPIWVAWHLPARWAFWAYVRVATLEADAPGQEFHRAHDAWTAKYDLK